MRLRTDDCRHLTDPLGVQYQCCRRVFITSLDDEARTMGLTVMADSGTAVRAAKLRGLDDCGTNTAPARPGARRHSWLNTD